MTNARKLAGFFSSVLFASHLTIGCSNATPSVPGNPFDVGPEIIVGPPAASHGATGISIDVYLDATTSMKGFAAPVNGAFDRFIYDIDAIKSVGWVGSLKYFKFGDNLRVMTRQDFLDAREPGAFYAEPGIYLQTNIERMLEKIDNLRISLVVTDLFQKEQDLNLVVDGIRRRCFDRDMQMAIIAVPSAFDGQVFDAKTPAFSYRSVENRPQSYRPFYIMMFGGANEIERCFEFLQTNPYISPDLFLLMSPFLFTEFKIEDLKPRAKGGLSKYRNEAEAGLFYYNLDRGSKGEYFDVTLAFKRNIHSPDFMASRTQFIVDKKNYIEKTKKWSAAQPAGGDLASGELLREEQTLKFRVRVGLSDPDGNYAYLVKLAVSPVDGLLPPDWVRVWSSENPTREHDPNKTLNLDRFVTNLLRASATVNGPVLGYFVIKIRHI